MIFRYPGGKSRKRIREWITSTFPSDYAEYREPMVGGGGVFWSIDPNVKRWVNDIHPGLMDVYVALRDRSEEFIRSCRHIPLERVKETFESVKLDANTDQAIRYYLINRVGWGGRVNYDIPSRLYFSNPTGWNIVNTDKLERAAEKMKGVQVTCGPYDPVLSAPGRDVLIYLDPPYVVNTKLSVSSQLYQHSFDESHHKKLAKDVRECNHKVIVSYDDNELIRELYQGFRIVENSWRYSGTHDGGENRKRSGREILILNY